MITVNSKLGTGLTLIGIALALFVLFREVKEGADSKRLADKVIVIIDKSGIEIEGREAHPSVTIYRARLSGCVKSQEDLKRLKNLLLDSLSPDEIVHLSASLYVDDGTTGGRTLTFWEDKWGDSDESFSVD